MKNLLITGLDGFTGFYLKKELENDYNILDTTNIDICNINSIRKIIQAVDGDISVIHLAAISSVNHNDIAEIYNTNIVGTRNILEAAKENSTKIKRLLIASSANIYGNQPGILNENSSLMPANDYAISKYAMEALCKLYSGLLDIVIVRPFNYTGRRQSTAFIIPKIVKAFKDKDKYLEIGNLDITRDFSDVRDIAIGYKNILQSKHNPQIINLCSGIGCSLQQVIDHCTSITNYEINIKINQEFVRKNEIKKLIGDRTKYESLYKASVKFNIKDTLKWMLGN